MSSWTSFKVFQNGSSSVKDAALAKLSDADVKKKLKAYEAIVTQLIGVAAQIEEGVEENLDLDDVEQRQERCHSEMKRLNKK